MGVEEVGLGTSRQPASGPSSPGGNCLLALGTGFTLLPRILPSSHGEERLNVRRS